jgi:hypothetical protein
MEVKHIFTGRKAMLVLLDMKMVVIKKKLMRSSTSMNRIKKKMPLMLMKIWTISLCLSDNKS